MASDNLVRRSVIKLIIVLVLALIAAVVLGLLLSKINNMENIELLLETNKPSLPSKLLDRNGELITEFYSDEKRDLVTLDQVPDFFIQALINWEDASFYSHHGFNLLAIIRAAVNNAMGKAVSGASTLTQQLSRTLFLNNEFSLKRKIKELWISMQLEKKYTKNEILSLYINHVPFGDGTNGVQAASKQFFNKDVSEITFAEAASLITVISNPTFYSINKFPKNHRTKQREVLKKMVRYGVISELEMEKSYNEFWLAYQQSAKSTRGAFYNREDKAPYFSDWVLQEIRKELPSVNVFKDGLTIHTTLDLKAQLHANKLMQEIFDRQQRIYEEQQMRNYTEIQNTYMDTIALISETFSLTNVNIDKDRDMGRAVTDFQNNINPMLNLTCQMLGLDLLETMTDTSLESSFEEESILAQVQGAFIALENDTGKILCMIGGKKFDPNNRFNYAMQARRQPGSSFKPFIYSAALDSGIYNAATVFVDKPYIFTFDSDDPDDWYKPNNYGGAYYGKVTFRRALRKSLNIPACQIFYALGKNNNYKVPIDRAAILLGLNSQRDINERFKPEVSTVLGTGSVSPVEMARGFAVFANLGQKRVPNSIVSIEDRDGRMIYEPWKELQKYYRENSKKLQVISQQNAFVMTDIMKDTVSSPDGMLYYRKRRMINAGNSFPDVELAAKTGTTQNFCDGWTVGYSPEITVAMWCGFKEYGLSLGNNQPGVTIHGNAFLDFMRVYHYNKGPMKFPEPSGIVRTQICTESGLLPSDKCDESHILEEVFIDGTQPTATCSICMLKGEQKHATLDKFIEKYEKTRQPQTQIFNDKVEYDKTIMRNVRKLKKNELSDVTLDIEGLNTVDLFEDDTYIDVDVLLGTKKKSKSGLNKRRSRNKKGSQSVTTTTINDLFIDDPYLETDPELEHLYRTGSLHHDNEFDDADLDDEEETDGEFDGQADDEQPQDNVQNAEPTSDAAAGQTTSTTVSGSSSKKKKSKSKSGKKESSSSTASTTTTIVSVTTTTVAEEAQSDNNIDDLLSDDNNPFQSEHSTGDNEPNQDLDALFNSVDQLNNSLADDNAADNAVASGNPDSQNILLDETDNQPQQDGNGENDNPPQSNNDENENVNINNADNADENAE